MKPLNINTYVLLKESTRENIYSIWVFFLFNICSNFCFKHNCLNSNLKTHCSDTCKASTLVWVRKKKYKFLTYTQKCMHEGMYWADVKWYVTTLYLYCTNHVRTLMTIFFHYHAVTSIFVWFAVFIYFFFFFHLMKSDGTGTRICMYVWMYVSVHITTRHDNSLILSTYIYIYVLYDFKYVIKENVKCSSIFCSSYSTVNKR